MGLANVLGGIAGLWGGIQQINQGNSLVRQGQGFTNQSLDLALTGYNQALKIFQNRQATGAYNAANALDLARRQAAHELNLLNGNTAAKMATAGFKHGDSAINQQIKHNVSDANFNLSNKLIDTQNQYDQMQINDLGMVGNANQYLSGLLANAANSNISSGTQMQQSAISGIGSIIGGGAFKSLGF